MERSRLGPGNYSDSLEHKHQRRGTLGTLGIQRRGDGGDTLLSVINLSWHFVCPLAPGCYTCSPHYSPSDGELDNSSAVSSRHNGLYGAGDLAPEHYYTVDTRLQTDHLFSVMSNIQLFVQVLFRSVICVYLVSSVAFWHFDIMSGVHIVACQEV